MKMIQGKLLFYVKAKSIGRPVILSDEEMERMAVKFQTYGQKKSKKINPEMKVPCKRENKSKLSQT